MSPFIHSICLSFLWGACLLHSREATLLFQSNPGLGKKCPPELRGVWTSELTTGTLKHVHKSTKIKWSSLSPDGTQIAVVSSDSLYLMANDGSGKRVVLAEEGHFAHRVDEVAGIRWTEKGIIWIANDKIKRFDPSTNEVSTIVNIPDIGKVCHQKMGNGDDGNPGNVLGSDVFVSTDGLRFWTRFQVAPKSPGAAHFTSNQMAWLNRQQKKPEVVNCSIHAKRGVHAFLQFTPDYKSFHTVWDAQWGHGQLMTSTGNVILVKFGTPHRDLAIFDIQNGNKVDTLFSWEKKLNPNYPPGYEARPIEAAINNPHVYVGFGYCAEKMKDQCKADGTFRPFLVDWKQNKLLGEFKLPKGGEIAHAMYPSHVWDGPLPAVSNKAFLNLSSNRIAMAIPEKGSPDPVSVTVSNTRTQSPGLIQVTLPESVKSWLKIEVDGKNRDSQVIQHSVLPGKLPKEAPDVTIRIRAAGADNELTYTLQILRGQTLIKPVIQSVEAVGDSLLDAKISWTPLPGNHISLILEKRKSGGTYVKVKEMDSQQESYTDKSLDYGSEWEYRLCAQLKFGNAVTTRQCSDSKKITVLGTKWIRVISPVHQGTVPRGEQVNLIWESNDVTNFYIQEKVDGQSNWVTVTGTGGILQELGRGRGEQPWQVPAQPHDSVTLRFVDYFTNEVLAIHPLKLAENGLTTIDREGPDKVRNRGGEALFGEGDYASPLPDGKHRINGEKY